MLWSVTASRFGGGSRHDEVHIRKAIVGIGSRAGDRFGAEPSVRPAGRRAWRRRRIPRRWRRWISRGRRRWIPRRQLLRRRPVIWRGVSRRGRIFIAWFWRRRVWRRPRILVARL